MSSDPQRPPSPSSGAARMERIVSLCKRRGFIFQSSEIYGGLNGCWDYGPLGVELKRKGHCDPVGARIILEAGGKKQARFAKGGCSYL
ncbi:MAG: hypothetical protein ABR611_15630, partial [Chthoniobacterales bacterium]